MLCSFIKRLGIFSLTILFIISTITPCAITLAQGKDLSSNEDPLSLGQGKEKMIEYAPGEVLVKLKEGADLREVLRGANIDAASISRVHSIKPAVERFKKDYALKKNKSGWYWFLGKRYKDINEIPDERLFKEAYKAMGPEEKALYRSYKVKLSEGVSVMEALARLRGDSDVEDAEPNYLSRIYYTPSDPLYSQQWAHRKTDAEQAWDISKGDSSIVVAIVDTGVDYIHEDLAANIWKDSSGNPGRDFVDIDIAEYELYGYRRVAGEDYTTIDDDPSDYYGHGTHCAGIAGASSNDKGVAGVAHGCKIMAVRSGFSIIHPIYGEIGTLESDDTANAIRYAADNGADVISMSFGGSSSQIEQDAINYAYSKGVVLTASAGNSDTNQRQYPAGYNNVIAVAATDQNDNKASFSNYGNWVDISAPGVQILSTVPTIGTLAAPSGYRALSGTSMASPYVAGLAALIKSRYPAYTQSGIKEAIYDGADNIGIFNIGHGRVNLYNSLQAGQSQAITARITSLSSGQISIGDTVTITGTASATNFSNYTVEVGEGLSPSVWVTTGVSLSNNGNTKVIDDTIAMWDSSTASEGAYTIRLTVYDSSGLSAEDKEVLITAIVHPGWPKDTVYGNSNYLGSPVIANIDGGDDLEIVAGTYEGQLYVWHNDGSVVSGWPVSLGGEVLTPAVGDLDNDGDMEIVAGCPNSNPHLFIFNHDGTPYAGRWPKGWGGEYGYEINFITDAPALADIDGDGDLEILIGNELSQLCAWHHTGEPVAGWPVRVQNAQNVTTPAVADIDGDGEPEVVVAESAIFGAGVTGNIYAFNADGSSLGGNWPVNIEGTYYPPVIGDIDGDGAPEIVVNGRAGLFALEADGTTVAGDWPKTLSGTAIYMGGGTPALADLDGDKIPEVILAARTGEMSKVWAFKGDGSTFGNWPYGFGLHNSARTYGAVIADVDADKASEVLTAVYDNYSRASYLYVFESDGSLALGYPKQRDIEYFSIPALGDIDNDGGLEIAAFGLWNGSTPVPFYLYELQGNSSNRRLDWPMFAGGPQHMGFFTADASAPSDSTPPTTPVVTDEGISTTNTHQLYASWVSTDPESGISEYLYRITEASSTGTVVKDWTSTGTDNFVTVTGLSLISGKSYYFGVKAKNTEGLFSLVGYSDGIMALSRPDSPSSLTASAVSSGRIDIAWKDNSNNEDGFKIERSLNSSTGFIQIAKIEAPDATAYSDTGLNASTRYYYKVRAYNSIGDSGYTNTADAVTPEVPPAKPTGLTAAAVSSSRIDLSWSDNSNNEDGFKIERSQSSLSGFVQIARISAPNTTTYSSTGLASGRSYYYRVRAYNSAGGSDYSNTANAATLSQAEKAPSISFLWPLRARAGRQIYIYGRYFGAQAESVGVRLSGPETKMVQVTSQRDWNDWRIRFFLPELTPGVYDISVVNNAGESAAKSIEVAGPEGPSVIFMWPGNATHDRNIYIYGNNFGEWSGSSLVRFSGPESRDVHIADQANWSSWRIVCKTPELASGRYELKVVNSIGESNPVNFNITGPPPPYISWINPFFSKAGTSVTIYGRSFGIRDSGSKIYIYSNGASKYITPSFWSDTEVRFDMPDLGASGLYNIEVYTKSASSSSRWFYFRKI